MSTNNSTSTLGFFKYFEKIVGLKMYLYIFLNLLVGLFDGIGLAMFVPLLSIATGSGDTNSLGKLSFILDFFEYVGFKLNLTNALLLIISIFIFKSLFVYLKVILFTKIRLKALKTMRFKMVDGLKDITYNRFTQMDAGTIHNNMVGETSRLITAMINYFSTIQNVILLSTYVVLAFFSNWQFAVLVAIGGLASNFIYKYINVITKRHAKELSLVGHDFNGNLIQAVHNFKYLKATNFFDKYVKKLKNSISLSEGLTYKLGKISALSDSIREPVIIMIISLVIIIQVKLIGGNFGSILVSLLLLYRALGYLVNMQSTWNGFIGASAGLESVEEILADFNNNKETFNPNNINFQDFGAIHLKDISVSFGDKKVLKNIGLTIPENTTAAFVGESGAGKTTLANVICGLHAPDSGEIIVGNQSLYQSNLEAFRNHVGYITQEPVIFSDTLFNNVTFWQEKTPENLKKFWDTIELVSLMNFVEQLPLKEDTPLGNNGILISGGQKQRISIARELYKDVKLLIMDEATSALDSETEQFIKKNIDDLQGKVTIVIIAHRLSTIRNVDHVYLLDNGEIKADGKFNELIHKSSRFEEMVKLQKV